MADADSLAEPEAGVGEGEGGGGGKMGGGQVWHWPQTVGAGQTPSTGPCLLAAPWLLALLREVDRFGLCVGTLLLCLLSWLHVAPDVTPGKCLNPKE